MEITEQKPKTNIFTYFIIVLLIIAIAGVYLFFFAPEKILQKKDTSSSMVNIAVQEFGKSDSTSSGLSFFPATSSDVTGGLSGLRLKPEEILNNPIFQSLRSYSEPIELPTLGRPNPFIPY